MSYADDEGHSDGIAFEPIKNVWEEGMHRTNEGTYMEIEEMETSHLINTINYFKKTHDVSMLENELEKRKAVDLENRSESINKGHHR